LRIFLVHKYKVIKMEPINRKLSGVYRVSSSLGGYLRGYNRFYGYNRLCVVLALICIGAFTSGANAQGTFNTSSDGAYTVDCESTLKISIDTTDSFWLSLGGADADYYINDDELTRTEITGGSYSDCEGTYNDTENVVEFDVALEGCGVSIISTDDNIQYNYTLWRDHKSKFAQDAIARYHLKKVSITCNYNRTLENTTSPINPNIRIGHYILDAISTSYQASLAFADSSYVAANAPSSVLVDDYIFVKGQIENAEARIKIQFETCWAHRTPIALADDANSYILIENGCPKNSTTDADNTIMIEANNDQAYAHFKFRSFVWNDDQTVDSRTTDIYVSCVMTACRDACTDTCGHTANYDLSRRRRRRRDADDEDPSLFSVTLMTGPVHVLN